jgi:hypothetical protein
MGQARIVRRQDVRVFCIITGTKVLAFLYPHYRLFGRLTELPPPCFFLRDLNSELMFLALVVDEISLKLAGCYYLPCHDVGFSKFQPSLACLVLCSDRLFLFDRRMNQIECDGSCRMLS